MQIYYHSNKYKYLFFSGLKLSDQDDPISLNLTGKYL